MKQFMIAMLVMATLAGCKKDKDITPDAPETENKKITAVNSVYDDGSGYAETYTYNAQGAIIGYTDEDDNYTFNYQSPTSLHITRKLKTTGEITLTYECTMNQTGEITKQVFIYPNGNIAQTTEYEYNAEGYVIREKTTAPNYNNDYHYEYANGNPVSFKRYVSGNLDRTGLYTVFANISNKSGFAFGGHWLGMFGKSFKNMVKEQKVFDKNGVQIGHTVNEIQCNAQGYATVIKSTYQNNSTQTCTYTFQ